MTSFVNRFTLQVTPEAARLILQDIHPRAPDAGGESTEQLDCDTIAEVVMVLSDARALRDMLVEHIKDPAAIETPVA